eukprot:gene19870-20373_t
MTEVAPQSRRRDRSKPPRSTGASLAALPRLVNPWAPLEILTAEQVERILAAAYRVLEEAGLEIRSAEARAIYARAGASVDAETQMVRLGRDLVEAMLALAPERFVLHARNPDRHLHVGGNVVNFGPVNGAPHITDRENGRRYGDLDAFRNILKLTHSLGILHWQGGIVVEPVDVPVPIRHLAAYQAHIEHQDIVWAARGVGGGDSVVVRVVQPRLPRALEAPVAPLLDGHEARELLLPLLQRRVRQTVEDHLGDDVVEGAALAAREDREARLQRQQLRPRPLRHREALVGALGHSPGREAERL